MEYLRKKYETKDLGGNKLRLHPLSCWHIGAAQCDLKWIHQLIDEIDDDPGARWYYLGDGGECVTKLSKGNLWEQTLTPQEQLDMLVDLLEPIKDKGIGGVRGNHGNRIYKETGIQFDKELMTRLGLHYQGVSSIVNINVNRSSYDVFFHHGTDSGASLQSKVNAAKKAYFINADVRVTAHSHVAMDLDPEFLIYADNSHRALRKKPIHQILAGCAYDSSIEGYAEEKLYSPILPGRAVIELDGRIIRGEAQHNVEVQIRRSMGAHDVVGYTKRAVEAWRG